MNFVPLSPSDCKQDSERDCLSLKPVEGLESADNVEGEVLKNVTSLNASDIPFSVGHLSPSLGLHAETGPTVLLDHFKMPWNTGAPSIGNAFKVVSKPVIEEHATAPMLVDLLKTSRTLDLLKRKDLELPKNILFEAVHLKHMHPVKKKEKDAVKDMEKEKEKGMEDSERMLALLYKPLDDGAASQNLLPEPSRLLTMFRGVASRLTERSRLDMQFSLLKLALSAPKNLAQTYSKNVPASGRVSAELESNSANSNQTVICHAPVRMEPPSLPALPSISILPSLTTYSDIASLLRFQLPK